MDQAKKGDDAPRDFGIKKHLGNSLSMFFIGLLAVVALLFAVGVVAHEVPEPVAEVVDAGTTEVVEIVEEREPGWWEGNPDITCRDVPMVGGWYCTNIVEEVAEADAE
jgi:hypothetical protein